MGFFFNCDFSEAGPHHEIVPKKEEFFFIPGCHNTIVVESKSLKVGKSKKIGSNRIKSEKFDLISY